MKACLKKILQFQQEKKPHTWRTVLLFIREMGFDEDEYFQFFSCNRDYMDKPIWDKQHWISVFWVIGGSEGYYVHVENRWNDEQGDHSDLIMIGKFWDWERAEAATQAVQRFVNLF